MAQLVLRRKWKRPPTGRIVLEEQHPLAAGLVLLVDWRRGAADVIRGPAPSTSYAGQVAATKGGEARPLTAEGHEFGYGPIAAEWTLMSFAQLGAARSALISQCSSDASKPQTYLCGNTDAGFGQTAGSLAFGRGLNAAETALITAPGAIDADPHAYLGLHSSQGVSELWRDGAKFASAAKSAAMSGADRRIRIEGIYTFSGWHSSANLHILDAVWAVGLLPELAQAVTENPWQIFRRDPERRYFGAGGSTSQDLAGSGTATASGSADLAAQIAVAGVGVSLASGSASLTGSKPLAASGAATATGTAAPAIAIALSALGLSVSSGTAALSSAASGSLAASGGATAGGSAALAANVTISASGLAQAAASAGLSAAVLLAGAGAAQAAGNGALAAQLRLAASGAAQAGGSAALQGSAAGQLSGYGQVVASGSAVLTLDVRLAATGGAQAGGSGALSSGSTAPLAASGGAAAGGSGVIAASISLTAAGFVQAMGAGYLVVQVPLSASGGAAAAGAAGLVDLDALVLIESARFAVRSARVTRFEVRRWA